MEKYVIKAEPNHFMQNFAPKKKLTLPIVRSFQNLEIEGIC